MQTIPSARARAAKAWGVTTTSVFFDVIRNNSRGYVDRCRCDTLEYAMKYALRCTDGRPRTIAEVCNPHLGIIAVISGNRSDIP